MVELYHEMSEKVGVRSVCLYGTMDSAARKISMYKFREREVRFRYATLMATTA